MPSDPISRRVVGGYMWRDTVERCLRLENKQMETLQNLIAKADKIEDVRRYSAMLADKVEIVTMLNELLRYSDKNGDSEK